MDTQKMKRTVNVVVFCLAWLIAIVRFREGMPYHTADGLNIVRILLLIFLVKLLDQFPLSGFSYLLLVPVMYIEMRAQSLSHHFFVLDLLFDTGILLFWQTGKIRQYFMDLSILALASTVMMIIYDDLIGEKFVYIYYEIGMRFRISTEWKTAFLVFASIIFMTIFIVSMRFLARTLEKKKAVFGLTLEKFHGLEVYVFVFVVITLNFFDVLRGYLPVYSKILIVFEIFMVIMNVAYFCLLLKTVSIKEEMKEVQNDKNSILAYQNELETTLDDMREVRHDVKNLFLTMGNFVERSDDEEMKEFYYRNVVPFMQGTIIKSELCDKLKILTDERLKSFFYYKLTEVIDGGIHVCLEVDSSFPLDTGYGDIVRLLGIFIDNAAQEAALTDSKSISVKISEDATGNSIRIGNEVRPEKRKSGITAGTTDKGLGRGKGLLIAGKIIAKYSNLWLNSYFTEEEFVQCLVVVRK